MTIVFTLLAACAGKPAPVAAAPAGLQFPDEAFRKERPAPGPTPAFTPPVAETFTLANGVQVFLVERHELPTVSLNLVFGGGRASDPVGKEGRAAICTELVGDGTAALDKVALSGALADLGASLRTFTSNDQVIVSLDTLKKHLDPGLDLFADVLLRPGMRADEHARVVNRRVESVAQQKGSAPGVANRVTSLVAYGEKHPLGRLSTEASLRAVTVADCRAFAKDLLKPTGAQLFVAGDVTRAELLAELDPRFAGWRGAPKLSPIPAPPPQPPGIFLVNVAGAPQSVVQVMHLGPARQAPDAVATEIMAAILGGGFASRINMNIREAKGWAYGARGGFNFGQTFSLFTAGGSIRADATVDAVKEILAEMKRMRTTDVTEAELNREREGALLSIPGQFATGEQVLQRAQELQYYGLPADWWSTYVPRLQATTAAGVRAAAEAHLRDDVRILVVGDAASIAPKLAELGPVTELDADGRTLH